MNIERYQLTINEYGPFRLTNTGDSFCLTEKLIGTHNYGFLEIETKEHAVNVPIPDNTVLLSEELSVTI